VTRGVIDGVLPANELRDAAAKVLALLLDPPADSSRDRRPAAGAASIDGVTDGGVWANIEATRAPDRPGLRELLTHGSDSTVLLSGTTTGERNPAVVVALARLDGVACVVVGHDRAAEADTPLGPAGLRQAQRGMRLAQELNLPLV